MCEVGCIEAYDIVICGIKNGIGNGKHDDDGDGDHDEYVVDDNDVGDDDDVGDDNEGIRCIAQ